MKTIIINGPNLQNIGERESDIYGKIDINKYFEELKKKYDFEIFQSNIEGEIINKLYEANNNGYELILLNAGAYTHTSIAIADCINNINSKVIEIHISNIFDREEFRNKSLISKNCFGHISGFGLDSYSIALNYYCSNTKS